MKTRKETSKLVAELRIIHTQITDIIGVYLSEYADYGWDAICNELNAANAQLDATITELKYARQE
ncbi:MAG: hypothetical protein IJH36_03225 [Clostridia bacterium]|nr:hypothetical protein [Clostridia bacterium]MBQ3462113.1 hypothetical protein [Clostridia bacterium]MBQ3472243.1 hypothetical protein [Clostridia bacterium]MBR0470972.1 hypothetical protein [Clostridia bacterium]